MTLSDIQDDIDELHKELTNNAFKDLDDSMELKPPMNITNSTG